MPKKPKDYVNEDKYRTTSFYLKPQTGRELDHIVKIFGENRSAVITRLINTVYTSLVSLEEK